MPEEKIWTGSPSQIKNLKPFAVCLLAMVAIFAIAGLLMKTNWGPLHGNYVLLLTIVPITVGVWKWLQVRSQKFELTTERLLVTSGVVNVVTRSLELYRVKDIRIEQPLFQRIFGLENVELTTSEISVPYVSIDHVPKSAKLGDAIRVQVEACRVAKGTRDLELNSNP